MTLDIRGPKLPHHEFTVNGYKVPGVTGFETDDGWNIVVDGRFAITATHDEMERWIWLLANGMAVAAGFTCHGENSQPMNRYNTQVAQIGAIDTDGTGDDNDPFSGFVDTLIWPDDDGGDQ